MITALEMTKVLLQHDNAKPHTNLKTREVISSFGSTTISHPPYSPYLAPSDFYLFLVYLFYLYIYPPDSQESDGGVNT